MCRIAAYLGPPVRLSALLHETPHGLTDQSRNARQMADSSVAGDGWGVGWFCPEAGPTPGLLKSILPLWSDENGKTATRAIISGAVEFMGRDLLTLSASQLREIRGGVWARAVAARRTKAQKRILFRLQTERLCCTPYECFHLANQNVPK